MTFAELIAALDARSPADKLLPFAVSAEDFEAIKADCLEMWGPRLIFRSHLIDEPNFVVNGGTPIVIEKPKDP